MDYFSLLHIHVHVSVHWGDLIEQIKKIIIHFNELWQQNPLLPTAQPQYACTGVFFENKIVAGLLTLPVNDLRNKIWCCYGNYMAMLKPYFKISWH